MSRMSPYSTKQIEHIRGVAAGPPVLSPNNNPMIRMTASEEYRRETVGERAALSLMCLCFLLLAASIVLFMAEFVGERHHDNPCQDECEPSDEEMAIVCSGSGCCAGSYYNGQLYVEHCTEKERVFLTWAIISGVISVISLCTAGYCFIKARHGIIRKKNTSMSKTLRNVKFESTVDNMSGGLALSPRKMEDVATPKLKGAHVGTPGTGASGFAFSPRDARGVPVKAVPAQVVPPRLVVKTPASSEYSPQTPRSPHGSPSAADVIKDAALRGISRRDLLACLQAPNSLPAVAIKTPVPEPPSFSPSPQPSPRNDPSTPQTNTKKSVRTDADWTSPPSGNYDPDMMSNFREIELVAVR